MNTKNTMSYLRAIIFIAIIQIGSLAVSDQQASNENNGAEKPKVEVSEKPSPIVTPTVDQTITPVTETYHSLVLGYMLSPQLTVSGVAYSGTTLQDGSFEYHFKDTIKFGYEWSQFKKQTWNHGFQIDYANSKFDTVTIKGSGVETSGALSGGMTILTASYTGKYRWNTAYLPINAGIASASTDSTGVFTKTMKARLYLAVGFGIVLSEKLNLEFLSSSYSVTSENVTSGSVRILPDVGYLSYTQLNLRILF